MPDGDDFTCDVCRRTFRVLLDEKTSKAAFCEQARGGPPEPLHLPKGSIRALVAVTMGVCSWVLIIVGQTVPASLLSLVLTIVGYYFGFRAKSKYPESRIFDATARKAAPLFLPAGAVRGALAVGFVISAVVLAARGKLLELPYLEFFVILFGLIAGSFFARMMENVRETVLFAAVNHLKGLMVLVVTVALLVLFLLAGEAVSPLAVTPLCAVVSFYFGSRN